MLIVAALVLPLGGVEVGGMVFAMPLVVLLWAAVRTAAAAREEGPNRVMWTCLAASCALGAVACAVAVVAAILDGPATVALYVGSLSSMGLLGALVALARERLTGLSNVRWVDGLVPTVLVGALSVYFVVVPAMTAGEIVLTAIFLIDVGALLLGLMVVTAPEAGSGSRMAWGLVAACTVVVGGDGFAALSATGNLGNLTGITALLWAIAGLAIVYAAELEDTGVGALPADYEEFRGARWFVARIVLPLAAVLTLPAVALALAAAGTLGVWSGAYFGGFFVLLMVLAFGRQAYLLAENRVAVIRERGLRREALHRNQELEALTGLATTMTQTLEEGSIVERGLEVLHLAAGGTSSAMHVCARDHLRMVATMGEWEVDRPLVGHPESVPAGFEVTSVGDHHVARIPLIARGNQIGVVSLVRRGEGYGDEEVRLLRLLTDQLAVAVQNARDYREKLEQALRDPLTGLYNRRFLWEALEKELLRGQRYGSNLSLVIFDVDNFKVINDSEGHAAGDEVLRRIAGVAGPMVRPVDSFARVGGEEFALLLPETSQLDALLVAERVRTAISRRPLLPGRRVTVSGGVASCPQDATSLEELESRADSALYWAKRNGKDICAVASEVADDEGEGERDGMLSHLYALVASIDAQGRYTRDHSENVATYAVTLGQALGLEGDHVLRLRRAAFLHDIGKVAVSEAILNKPGALDAKERAEMALHPAIGASMLRHGGLVDEADWIRHHHERMDGRGYPDGVTGEHIPLEARIIFVADAFEAMTSDRPYRKGMPVQEALAELRSCGGAQFDRRVVEALTDKVQRGTLTVLALRRDQLPVV